MVETQPFAKSKILKSPIFTASLDAISTRLQELYKQVPQSKYSNIAAVQVGSVEGLRAVFKSKGDATEYPFFAYILSGVRKNTQSYNIQALRHYGINAGVRKDGQTFRTYHLTPVVASFRIIFSANSADQVNEFTELWASHDKLMNFRLESKGLDFSVAIRMLTSEELSIPDYQLDEVGGLWVLETELAMETYVGFINEVPGIIKKTTSVFVKDRETIEGYIEEGIELKPYGDQNAWEVKITGSSNPEL